MFDRTEFLHQLALHGNVSRATKAVGVSRQSVYDYRRNHGDFADQWDDALHEGVDNLEEIAFQQATSGQAPPGLIMFLLRSHRPSVYREPKGLSTEEGRALVKDVLIHVFRVVHGELSDDAAERLEASILDELSRT